MKKSLRDNKRKDNSGSGKNYEWFIKKADVDKYAGKWIAIENQRIVASGAKIDRLLSEIQGNWPNAAVTKIPKRGQIMVL